MRRPHLLPQRGEWIQLLKQICEEHKTTTDNANFETPEPPLETVTEVLDDYEQKLSMAKRRGGPEDTAAKNQARKAATQI